MYTLALKLVSEIIDFYNLSNDDRKNFVNY